MVGCGGERDVLFDFFGGGVEDGFLVDDAGVVDEDVDLELAGFGVGEVVLGCVDDVGWAGGEAHVGLDYEGGDLVLLGEEGGEGIAGGG